MTYTANETAFRDWKLTGAQSHVARSRKRRIEGRTQLGLAHLDAAARYRTSLLTAPRYQSACT